MAPPIRVMFEITRKSKRKICKGCNKNKYKVSQNGYCKKCMQEKMELARLEIKHKQGPIYEKYKRKMLEALQK